MCVFTDFGSLPRPAGHESSVNALCKLDKTTIASASYDESIRIWDLSSQSCAWSCDDALKGLASLSTLLCLE